MSNQKNWHTCHVRKNLKQIRELMTLPSSQKNDKKDDALSNQGEGGTND